MTIYFSFCFIITPTFPKTLNMFFLDFFHREWFLSSIGPGIVENEAWLDISLVQSCSAWIHQIIHDSYKSGTFRPFDKTISIIAVELFWYISSMLYLALQHTLNYQLCWARLSPSPSPSHAGKPVPGSWVPIGSGTAYSTAFPTYHRAGF